MKSQPYAILSCLSLIYRHSTGTARVSLALGSAALPLFLSCSPAEFKAVPSDLGTVYDAQETNPDDTVVCDPFGDAGLGSSREGLRGSIYELPDGLPNATSSFDMIKRGRRLPADLFMSRVYVPTRAFTNGFGAPGMDPLKNEKGETLFEWFGLKLDSSLKLAASDGPGEYQLAVISDDGSTLAIADAEGVFRNVVENDGDHPTKMGCANTTVRFDSHNDRKAMRLTYYQGPRDYIAAVMMWRKVSDASKLSEAECGKWGNSHFYSFNRDTRVSTETSAYKGLLARGWKPLAPDNFELRDNQTNKCR